MAGKVVTRDLTAQVKVTKTGKKGVLKDVRKDLEGIEKAGKQVGTGTQQGLKSAGAAAVQTARKVDNLEKQMKQLKAETRKAKKELRDFKKAGAGVGGLTKSFQGLKGVIGTLGFTAAFLGIQRGISAIIQASDEQNQALAQLNASLESTESAAGLTSEQLQQIATDLQKVTNFSDEAVIKMESILLTFTKVGGDVFPRATAAILDMSAKLGTDLKAAAIQVGKALNDPIKGITALAEAGVQFTPAQREMVESLVKIGQTAKAQAIILKELETQFGGSAEAARKASSGFDALQNAIGDLLEKLGEGGITKAVRDVNEALTELAQQEDTKQAMEGLGGLVAGLIGQFSLMGETIILTGSSMSALVEGFATLGSETASIDKFAERLLEWKDSIEDLYKPVEEAAEKIKPPLESISKGVDLMADGVLSANEVFLTGAGGMDEWGASAEDASQRFVNAANAIKLSGEEIATAIDSADQEMQSFAPSGLTIEEALKRIQGGLDNTADKGFLKFQEEALAAGVSIDDFVKEGDSAAEKYEIWQAKLQKVADAEAAIAEAAEKAKAGLNKIGESSAAEDLGVIITEAGSVVTSLEEIGKVKIDFGNIEAARKMVQGFTEDLKKAKTAADALDKAGGGGGGSQAPPEDN